MKIVISQGREDEIMKEKVSPLIREAFGKRTRGDYSVFSEGFNFSQGLETIYEKSTFGFLYRYIGHFNSIGGSTDGSSLSVREKYLAQAKIYAELYEKEFGKEVRIKVIE